MEHCPRAREGRRVPYAHPEGGPGNTNALTRCHTGQGQGDDEDQRLLTA